jgi:excisionase family DNA binding protein
MSTPPPDVPPLDPLYSISRAADLLGLTPRSLYQICARGEIKVARPTKGAVRIPHSELHRMMQARTEVRQVPRKKRRATPVGMANSTVAKV